MRIKTLTNLTGITVTIGMAGRTRTAFIIVYAWTLSESPQQGFGNAKSGSTQSAESSESRLNFHSSLSS